MLPHVWFRFFLVEQLFFADVPHVCFDFQQLRSDSEISQSK